MANPEPDRALRPGRRRDQLPQRFEDLTKLLVVLAQTRPNVQFHLIEAPLQALKGARDTPQFDERSHDLDVHGNSSITAKNAREHRHPLLGEDQRTLAATAVPALDITNCDFKLLNSSIDSWNMKSAGKRFSLRRTCCTSTRVSTP
ncbi:MAG: hypothetical protein WA862_00125 [Solirubrobacterales bacterium]